MYNDNPKLNIVVILHPPPCPAYTLVEEILSGQKLKTFCHVSEKVAAPEGDQQSRLPTVPAKIHGAELHDRTDVFSAITMHPNVLLDTEHDDILLRVLGAIRKRGFYKQQPSRVLVGLKGFK
jgi:hypothetical protein